MACSPACKKGTVFSVGTLLLLGGILAGLFWCDQLSLSPSSVGFKMWRETPIPMYLELRFFNWTNPEEVKAGKAKPKVQQVGPYTYLEKHTRVNMKWHPENDSITFQQIREWHFVPSKSSGTPDDQIVSLNVLATAIASLGKNLNGFYKALLNAALSFEESFAVKRTVRELLFDGYEDPILHKAAAIMKHLNISLPEKFGWFYARNMSETYDGTFNMYTGQQNMSQLGMLHSWNYASHTQFFSGSCGDVYGTTGELLPPILGSTKLPVFASDLCSYVSLNKSEKMAQKFGIEGVRFEGSPADFDNGTHYPEYKCFAVEGKNMPSGVRDMSKCRHGAPAYVSYPHFLDADSWYTDSVDGLSPNRSEHGFVVEVEPSTGLPLEVKAQLQINILLEPISGLSMYEKVPRVLMPMFYFRQTAELTPDLGDQVKLLLNLSRIGTITLYGFAGIGAMILTIAVIITVRGNWGDDDEAASLITPPTDPDKRPQENSYSEIY